MKIQYVGTNNSWVKRGETFTVLSIEQNSQEVMFRIIAGEADTPSLFSAKDFEIVDNYMPSTWVVNILKNGKYIELAPKAWLDDGFWERYFDMNFEAVKTFKEEVKKINIECK